MDKQEVALHGDKKPSLISKKFYTKSYPNEEPITYATESNRMAAEFCSNRPTLHQ